MGAADASGTRFRYLLALVVGVLVVPSVLGSSQTIFNDGDVSWHLATGQWIIDHRSIPRMEPFSFTRGGTPWVPIEWLAETIMASAYRLAGYPGVSALATAALVTLHGIVFLNAMRAVRPLIALTAVLAMDAVLIPMMLARPHLLAWVLLAAWTVLMVRVREQGRAPHLAIALLMVIWSNLHGSFVVGLLVAGAFGLEALLVSRDRARALREWALFGLACIVAAFVNANGLQGVLHPFMIANQDILPLVEEWKPSNPAVTPFFFAVLLATLTLILWKRPKLHPARWLLLVALLALAMFQVRHQAILAVVAAILLPLGFAAEEGAAERESRSLWLVAAGALALVAIRFVTPMSPPVNEANPWPLIASVPQELRSQPVLNGYVMGGPLILSGIRPYIDGRADMYGDAFVLDYKRITDGDAAALQKSLDRWDIRWAILPHRSKKLLALLDNSSKWKRIRQDKTGVVYVRD